MASDLVAHHHRYLAPSHQDHIIHGPCTFSMDCSFFDVYEYGFPASLSRLKTYLIFHSENLVIQPIKYLSEILFGVSPRDVIIHSYDESILDWIKSFGSCPYTVELYSEMKLVLSPQISVTSATALSLLQEKGFDIKENPDWFCAVKLEAQSTVTQGGERVYTVTHKKTQKVVAFVTLLVDTESGRILITSLHTNPAWQGKGLEKMLVRHIHEIYSSGSFSLTEIDSKAIKCKQGKEVWIMIPTRNFAVVEMYRRFRYQVCRTVWIVRLHYR